MKNNPSKILYDFKKQSDTPGIIHHNQQTRSSFCMQSYLNALYNMTGLDGMISRGDV